VVLRDAYCDARAAANHAMLLAAPASGCGFRRKGLRMLQMPPPAAAIGDRDQASSSGVRWWLLLWVAIPALAFARPKIAVAPLAGDDDGKVTAAVAEEASQHATVIDPQPTQKALARLGYDNANSKKAQKALRKRLGVDVIIYGTVDTKGSKQKLTLEVSGRGKRAGEIELSFKTASSNKFREELRDELGKQLAGAEGEASEDDDGPRRPFRHGGDDGPRHPLTESAVWIDGGPSGLHRSLTYETTGAATPPPPVGTASFSGQLEAEIYPAAFDSLQSAASGFGFAATVAKTVGLSIAVPGTTASASINEARYTIGARYRFHFGQTTLATGVAFWHQTFIADRSSLMGATLDMPDTSYNAVAPQVAARFAITPKIAILAQLDIPLIFSSGQITTGAQLGQATIIAGAGEGAVDFSLAEHYGLRFALLFDEVDFLFQSPRRGVSSAIDRTLGLTATFALFY